MKIEAAEVAGDVDDLADEIKPGDGSGFEGFRGEPRSVDATQRHLRGAIAFGPVRPDAPMLHRRSDLGEMHIGEIGDAFGTSGQFRNGARKPLRKAIERGLSGGCLHA